MTPAAKRVLDEFARVGVSLTPGAPPECPAYDPNGGDLLRFIQIIRPGRTVPKARIAADLVAAVDDILHHAPRSEHASWYRTWLAIRRLPEVGRSAR